MSISNDILRAVFYSLDSRDISKFCRLNKDLYSRTENNDFWVEFSTNFLSFINNPMVDMKKPGSARKFVCYHTVGSEAEAHWRLATAVSWWHSKKSWLKNGQIQFSYYLDQDQNPFIIFKAKKKGTLAGAPKLPEQYSPKLFEQYYFRNEFTPSYKFQKEITKNNVEYSYSYFNWQECGYPFILGSKAQHQAIRELTQNFAGRLTQIHEKGGCENGIKCKKDKICAKFIGNAKEFLLEYFENELTPEKFAEISLQISKINVDNFDNASRSRFASEALPVDLKAVRERIREFTIQLQLGDDKKMDAFFDSLVPKKETVQV